MITVMILNYFTSCHRRWQHYLKPKQEGYKDHDWTLDEVEK